LTTVLTLKRSSFHLTPQALCVDAVSFAFGSQTVLDCVTFDVHDGEFVALTGPNGAGKSTLLRILLGLLPPLAGTVEVFGASPRELRDRWRIGYVPQRSVLPENLPATVEEVVATGRLARRGWSRRPGLADREAVSHALESVLVNDLRRRRMHELSWIIGTSGVGRLCVKPLAVRRSPSRGASARSVGETVKSASVVYSATARSVSPVWR
jgi:zinc transport system ATP-binding protein